MIRLRFLLLSLALVAGPLAAGQAQGYDIRTGTEAVVELFTSQGCPRCPEADAYLTELRSRETVVALAYHIDYWDYIGWEDTFALPANTELQKAYAASWGKARVYTPQMVVNGAHGVVGSKRRDVETALSDSHLALDLAFSLADGDAAHLTAPPQAGIGPAIVWLVTFRAEAEVPVARGENSGKTLRYSNIVTGRQAIGMWNPETGADIAIPLEAALGHNDGAAIIVQEKNGELPGPIVAAAMITR